MLASERLKVVHVDANQLAVPSGLAQKEAADLKPASRKGLQSFEDYHAQAIHDIQAETYG
jgi:hypothetical protein